MIVVSVQGSQLCTMLNKMKLVAVLLLACLVSADAARILGVFPYHGKSHFIMFESLMKGLATKGHQVTVVSHFPQEKSVPNYRDLSLKGSAENIVGGITADMVADWGDTLTILDFMFNVAGLKQCEDMYKHPAIQEVIRSQGQYDLFVSELWSTDCFVGIAHKLGLPHVAMISTMETPWSLARYGSPFHPGLQTTYLAEYSLKAMPFWDRFWNTLFTTALNTGYNLIFEPKADAIMRQHLGADTPYLRDIIYNSSLLLTNGHFSQHYPRALAPNIIEVAGLHIPEPKPLPADLQKFLDEAKDGVIVFSLGSMVKAESFDQARISSFVEVFRKLPQKVIWKFGGKIENQPKNLMVTKWLPQSDILRHPNVRLFITHGGLMGTQEAVLSGVPLVGIPLFGDQRFNIKNYVDQGVAVQLEITQISREIVESKIRTVLEDPSYTRNAKELSRRFNDRPMTAMQTAIYWVEYVLRHNGAPHLRSAARDMTWYQYYLLDVLAVLLAMLLLVALLLLKLVRFITSPSRGNTKKFKTKTK